MRYSGQALVDHLASSYVLGTLSAPTRRRFERLARDRADVALAVAQWQERLGTLAQSVPPMTPSPGVWAGIEARTRGTPPARTRAAGVTPQAPTGGGHRGGGSRYALGWGLAGLALGVLSLGAVVATAPGLLVSPDRAAMQAGQKLPQSYVGLLTDAQGNGKVLVSSLRHGTTLTVKVIGPIAPPGAGQHLVLWAVPAEGAPFVLGGVPAKGSATSQLPGSSEQLLAKVSKLMVSLEATSTPATPGSVVFTGNCAKLW